MVCVPGKAIVGSKVPSTGSVIPFPDQVPPGSAAVRLIAFAVSQKGPTGLIVAFADVAPSVTVTVPKEVHPLLSVTETS